jgi:predicted TIM-barrel fold metal-dependent hydrolase
MRIEDAVLVSIDDHVIEPPDMFDRHIPARFKDQAPRVETVDGLDQWMFLGTQTGSVGLNAVASWPKEEWGFDPVGFAEMRPGAYDIHQRVRDMDVNGVLASMCFPTFAGFAGTHLVEAGKKDPELAEAVIRAYNDWHIDEWCATYPGRFLPLCILPTSDFDAMVAEIHRIGAKGCRAVTMPEISYSVGLPSFYGDAWDPVFTALCDEDIAMCLHIGGAYNMIPMPAEGPPDQIITLAPQLSAIAANHLIISETFKKFPTLRAALSEGGIGWIPFYLDRLDRHVWNHQWTGLDIDGKGSTPTQVFREHFLGCFITDPSALRLIDRMGEDVVAWECDYPHSDSTWPRSPEELLAECDAAGLSDATIEKITWENASRFFRFDPFKHFTREQGCVGGLRAKATDVDTSVTTRAEYRRRYEAAAAPV